MKNNKILCDSLPALVMYNDFFFYPVNDFFFQTLDTSVLHEMHKMTGLRQLVHLVTKITVSHLLELIHHWKWSVPFLCLLATAYPLVLPLPHVYV